MHAVIEVQCFLCAPQRIVAYANGENRDHQQSLVDKSGTTFPLV